MSFQVASSQPSHSIFSQQAIMSQTTIACDNTSSQPLSTDQSPSATSLKRKRTDDHETTISEPSPIEFCSNKRPWIYELIKFGRTIFIITTLALEKAKRIKDRKHLTSIKPKRNHNPLVACGGGGDDDDNNDNGHRRHLRLCHSAGCNGHPPSTLLYGPARKCHCLPNGSLPDNFGLHIWVSHTGNRKKRPCYGPGHNETKVTKFHVLETYYECTVCRMKVCEECWALIQRHGADRDYVYGCIGFACGWL